MHSQKTIPTAIVGALGLFLLGILSSCGRNDQTASAPSPAATASAPASGAEASASDAQASAAAIASAKVPSAGTVANAAGDNQKTPPPAVNVAEEARSAGDESPQELRDKVAAAKAAGRAP